MVKKVILLVPLCLILSACATVEPPLQPFLYIENLPPALVSSLSLEERIAVEEAWREIRIGRAAKAEKILLRLGPESPAYFVGIGYIRFLIDDLASAEENFKLALENAPDLASARIGLAQIYQKSEREEQAFSEYQEALKADPGNDWARQEFKLLRDKKLGEYRDTAQAYAAEGDQEHAREAYLKALFFAPDSIEAHLALAEIYRSEDRADDALVHLKAAADLEPDNAQVLKAYADALFGAEQYQRSLDLYENLREMDAGDKDVQARIENLKNKLGIFELPGQYGTIAGAPVVSREDLAALLGVKFKDVLETPVAKPPIIVDIATSWASKFIIRAASLGILDVYANHAFEPKKVVTRAEMAEILLRLIDYLKGRGIKVIQSFPPEKIQVSDVPPEHVYFQPIVQILAYQIMDLSALKAFRPDQSLSGSEAIKAMDILLALIR